MKFENIRVMNFQNALRGMRNPKNSWHLSDSEFGLGHLDWIDDIARDMADLYLTAYDKPWDENLYNELSNIFLKHVVTYVDDDYCEYAAIGPKDMKLAQALIKGGPEHRKFLRQIFVSVDITAPLYWWKEFDTYKVGTVANSTSTMHKMAAKPITLDCFEIDDYDNSIFTNPEEIDYLIQFLEGLRLKYIETKDKRFWKELIRWLPESWLQTRTVTMDYENFLAMCSKGQRRFHKLNEWSGQDDATLPNFIAMSRDLPYAQHLIFLDELAQD